MPDVTRGGLGGDVAYYRAMATPKPPGPNDKAMAEPHTPWGDAINSVVNKVTSLTGYDSHRVTDPPNHGTDNPFYRDNAQHMPGWGNTFGLGALDPHGVPSGATAQDRATNYVGQDDPTGVWNGVRKRLVTNQQADIDALPKGPDGKPQGNISFGQVYGAHVDAYHDTQAAAHADGSNPTAANGFIDPGSFALAMYGAPLMEHLGINSGPITGASIDYFNDPTDTATSGWAKRMGLAGGEMAAGSTMMMNPLTAPAGLATMGLGAFGAAWNTGTAVKNGMLDEWGNAIGDTAGAVGNGIANGAKGLGKGLGNLTGLW